MELLKIIYDIEFNLQDLSIKLDEARNLLLDGREINCDRKLQGAQTKISQIIENIKELKVKDGNMVDKTN